MTRIALTLLAATAGCGLSSGFGSGSACVQWPDGAQPLLVGDTLRLRSGTLQNGSDCVAPSPQPVIWTSVQPSVASVDADGLVRGLTPGRFNAVGISGSDTLHAKGFVLPPGWSARIIPDSVTVQVGDKVPFIVVALDSLGVRLPAVPYWLYTPAWARFGSPDAATKPIPPQLTTESAFQYVTAPSVFHMEKAGITILNGRIGDRRVTATLVVLPAGTARP